VVSKDLPIRLFFPPENGASQELFANRRRGHYASRNHVLVAVWTKSLAESLWWSC